MMTVVSYLFHLAIIKTKATTAMKEKRKEIRDRETRELAAARV